MRAQTGAVQLADAVAQATKVWQVAAAHSGAQPRSL
jgi:hypothetical protein